MQDINTIVLLLSIIVIVTFTVLDLLYPASLSATDAIYKRMQHQADDMLKQDVNEYIVSYVPNCNNPEVQYLTDDMAAELKEHAYSVEKIGDPLSEICDKPDDEWDNNYPM